MPEEIKGCKFKKRDDGKVDVKCKTEWGAKKNFEGTMKEMDEEDEKK
jgi:hypothetical protein